MFDLLFLADSAAVTSVTRRNSGANNAAKLGITVHAAEVKDVMFPAELKRAFADVLKAKQEGQAALERARGESAALRNLANFFTITIDVDPSGSGLRFKVGARLLMSGVIESPRGDARWGGSTAAVSSRASKGRRPKAQEEDGSGDGPVN